MTPGPNARAWAVTVMALVVAGELGPADEALITAGATLAAALDADPAKEGLHREYRMVLALLTGVDDAKPEGDSDEEALVLRFRQAALGDATA